MMAIKQATEADLPAVRALFREYMIWTHDGIVKHYHFDFDAEALVQHDMDTIAKFMPPGGRLLLTFEGGVPAACACTHTIAPGMAEMKRTYVRPEHRRKGLGRALVEALIGDLRGAGFTTLRLDTARFMLEAQALYRTLGFREIPPYPESEIPEDGRKFWLFMEHAL